MTTKTNGILQIILIYLLIALSGFLSWKYLPIENEVLAFLAADLVMTVVCFAFSVIKKNSSVYDAYWSVIPFFFVLQWSWIYFQDLSLFHLLAFLVISIWSWRLTLNWARGWSGMAHEDWRYVALAQKHGSLYPFVNFSGIHLFPTLLVFAGMWPLFYLFEGPIETTWLFYLGMAVSLLGTTFEFFADNQLAKFKRRPNPKPEELLDTGIWSRSRNPNYLGEILFWVGLFFIGFSFGAPWYTGAGFVVMLFLFVFISIPLKEERMLKRRPGFTDYKKRVPMLLPKFW